MARKHTGKGEAGDYAPNHHRLYNFDIDGYDLKTAHTDYIKAWVLPWLAAGNSVTIKGLTSRSGSQKYNLQLSQQRADEVVHYLYSKVSTPKIFKAKGLGESVAERDGMPDGSEEKYHRAVDIVLSRRPCPVPVPPKKKRPNPPKEPGTTWKVMTPLLVVDVLDAYFIKRMVGSFQFAPPAHNLKVLVWEFVSMPKGFKLGVKTSSLFCKGRQFMYDKDLVDPFSEWKARPIFIDFTFSTLTLTVFGAISRHIASKYRPYRGPGVRIRGRDLRFRMKADSAEFGSVSGFGTISRPRWKPRSNWG